MDGGSKRGGPVGFRIIGVFKIICAILFAGIGLGIARLFNRDVGAELLRIVSGLKLDPNNHAIHTAVEAISGVTPGQLRAISFGTFFYAALYLTEGVGLVLERRWAGYLTVIATGSLIPVEIYEVGRKVTELRLAVLIINVAILVYLVVKLIQERRADKREESPSATSISSAR